MTTTEATEEARFFARSARRERDHCLDQANSWLKAFKAHNGPALDVRELRSTVNDMRATLATMDDLLREAEKEQGKLDLLREMFGEPMEG